MLFCRRLSRRVTLRDACIEHLVEVHAAIKIELGEVLTLQERNGLSVWAQKLYLSAEVDFHVCVIANTQLRVASGAVLLRRGRCVNVIDTRVGCRPLYLRDDERALSLIHRELLEHLKLFR